MLTFLVEEKKRVGIPKRLINKHLVLYITTYIQYIII